MDESSDKLAEQELVDAESLIYKCLVSPTRTQGIVVL